ncbi:hypothetical protein VSDG_09921 [Cytospora chrysosperma]|uniref:Signal recognition particle subunit SRP72 n=1 Tax=Cytospora chrysosperma TaxID=252740 RepID=A0A423V9J7_CYTCH|nr:hypothetical protein VSDG_09921 [Valsa sordida]
MEFGAGVAALLETYDNCLKLLRAFKRQNKEDGSYKVTKASKQQALLKHSLKSDRKKVERAYASRLSVAGRSFERGDPKSIAALSKVLKKLNAAIARLMQVASKSPSPVFDYQSLMTLSNSSRVQAIKTFDQLSRRLGSKPPKPAGPSASSRDGPRKGGPRKGSPKVPKGHADGSSSARRHEPKDGRRRHDRAPGTQRKHHASKPPPGPAAAKGKEGGAGSGNNAGRRTSFLNRFSLMSMASDSTRLGEIPERKWHRKYDPLDGSLDEYNTPVMYPIRPYQKQQPKEKKFLGLIDDHDEALEIADAAIAASKNPDPTAQHTKVVALLRLERYDDALRAIASAGTALEARCTLEKAYALPLRHVAAQVAYRAERFDEAAALYAGLMEDAGAAAAAGETTDLVINQLATHAQLEWQGRGDLVPEGSKQPRREDMEAFETAYNAGCGCVARGDLAKASVLLKRAADLCDAAEDLSDEDKGLELLPIVLQQAYVLTLLGRTEEAAELQKSIEDDEIPDASIKAVAGWNSLLLKQLSNPYMVQRLSELVPEANTGNSRLFKHQAVGVMRNQYANALQCYKQKEVKDKTTALLKEDPTPSVDLDRVYSGYFSAAAKTHSAADKEALKKTLTVLEKRPYDVGLLLTIIHLYVQAKNYDSAIDVLQRFFKYVEAAGSADHEDVRYAPGLVALAVALYRTQNRRRDARDELRRAAAHWQGARGSPPAALLREAGAELLRSPRPADLATAGAAFGRMVRRDPADRVARAGLVASLAGGDYAGAEPHLDSLAPVGELVAGIDVSALLDAGVPAFVPAAAHPQHQQQAPSRKRKPEEGEEGATAATGKAGQQQPAQKKRKPRLPKNHDPAAKPDPERWLPMRDRSYYKPKGRKGKRRAAESTQGGAVAAASEGETLSLAGGAGQIKGKSRRKN